LFLAAQARHAHVLIRGPGLRDTMSRYLVCRIEETRNITLDPHTELVALDGYDRLRSVAWRGAARREPKSIPSRMSSS
jgi:thioredoxin reductase (NADPH)